LFIANAADGSRQSLYSKAKKLAHSQQGSSRHMVLGNRTMQCHALRVWRTGPFLQTDSGFELLPLVQEEASFSENSLLQESIQRKYVLDTSCVKAVGMVLEHRAGPSGLIANECPHYQGATCFSACYSLI
jgi:hypothetical protein